MGEFIDAIVNNEQYFEFFFPVETEQDQRFLGLFTEKIDWAGIEYEEEGQKHDIEVFVLDEWIETRGNRGFTMILGYHLYEFPAGKDHKNVVRAFIDRVIEESRQTSQTEYG